MNAALQFRLISLLEGISYLLLMGVGMPLKYLWHQPSMVRVVGSIHGILFLLFVLSLFRAKIEYRWRYKHALILFGASLIPFGFLYIDKWIRRHQPQT